MINSSRKLLEYSEEKVLTVLTQVGVPGGEWVLEPPRTHWHSGSATDLERGGREGKIPGLSLPPVLLPQASVALAKPSQKLTGKGSWAMQLVGQPPGWIAEHGRNASERKQAQAWP